MESLHEEAWDAEVDREQRLTEIMNDYGDDLLKLVYSYVKRQDIAEDLTQDIFLKVYQRLHQFEQRSSLKTWLYRIAINCSKDYIKSWHVKNVRIHSEADFIHSTAERETPEGNVVARSEEEELVTTVLSLPLKYREVVYLYYYEEYNIKTISELLSINENTVKTRLFQARRKLKKKLQEKEDI